MNHYPKHLCKLIEILKRFPGVGSKSAERFAFHMLDWPNAHLEEMTQTIRELKVHLKHCDECGCLMDQAQCQFCSETKRDLHILCIVASPKEVYSIEQTREYKGLYHILGGLLSPMDDCSPSDLRIDKLMERIHKFSVEEIIIALDSTLEGDATSLHLQRELANLPVRLSRLAFGLPMGSSLDYVDGGTLSRAFSGRRLV